MPQSAAPSSTNAYDEWPECPDTPPLHLKGGYLCIASPLSLTEACFSVPAVRALRHYRLHSTIAIVCPDSQTAMWEMMPQVNHVISYPEKSSATHIAALLKAHDVTYESTIAWEAGEVAKAFKRMKILQRLGYPAPKLKAYLTDEVDVVTEIGPIAHRVRYYLDFVERLGGNAYRARSFQTEYRAQSMIENRLRIGLVTDSTYGSSYHWPQESFAEVKNLIAKQFSEHEIEWVEIQRNKGVSDTLDVLGDCHALLACDSEIAHLAAHLGLPAVVIFGPNSPDLKRPLGKQSKAIQEYVACNPCFLSRCPIDLRCQKSLSMEKVVSELADTLESIRKVLGSAEVESV